MSTRKHGSQADFSDLCTVISSKATTAWQKLHRTGFQEKSMLKKHTPKIKSVRIHELQQKHTTFPKGRKDYNCMVTIIMHGWKTGSILYFPIWHKDALGWPLNKSRHNKTYLLQNKMKKKNKTSFQLDSFTSATWAALRMLVFVEITPLLPWALSGPEAQEEIIQGPPHSQPCTKSL